MQVSAEEKELLKRIGQAPRFPIVRFELRSSRERSLISTALNHVYLEREIDSMEQVKQRAKQLENLEAQGLICLNYKIFITVKSDYRVYERSSIFNLLSDMVMEGKHRPGFLFDIPYIKRGMATLTDAGREWLESQPE